MIITRTPFRISFAGGGTDLKEFYRIEPGEVISTAIKKYMYITVNPRFDSSIRVSYSHTEIVPSVDDIKHPIVREALKLVGIEGGIEIVSIADIPSGTGLGSSSSFTVGLLNALYAYKGILKSAEDLASQACRVEIELMGEPIGKQDQYIAAYGGMRSFQFNPDESVFVNPIIINDGNKKKMEQSLLLIFTGEARSASNILREQRKNIYKNDKFRNLQRMKDLANATKECLMNEFSVNKLGEILHQGWLYKKELATSISNDVIDAYYEKALKAGAIGGKLLGAGGGGFLLLICPAEKRSDVIQALGNLQEMEVSFEPEGSKIIYIL